MSWSGARNNPYRPQAQQQQRKKKRPSDVFRNVAGWGDLTRGLNATFWEKMNNKWREVEEFVCPCDAQLLTRPFQLCPLDDVVDGQGNVLVEGGVERILISQCPYPYRHQATGLTFEVPNGCEEPKSLRILRNLINGEFGTSAGTIYPSAWARQKCLLLNANLMSIEGSQDDGSDIDWKQFVQFILRLVVEKKGHNRIPTLAVGSDAQAVVEVIIDDGFVVRTHHAVSRSDAGMFHTNSVFTTLELMARTEDPDCEPVDWTRKERVWVEEDIAALSDYFA